MAKIPTLQHIKSNLIKVLPDDTSVELKMILEDYIRDVASNMLVEKYPTTFQTLVPRHNSLSPVTGQRYLSNELRKFIRHNGIVVKHTCPMCNKNEVETVIHDKPTNYFGILSRRFENMAYAGIDIYKAISLPGLYREFYLYMGFLHNQSIGESALYVIGSDYKRIYDVMKHLTDFNHFCSDCMPELKFNFEYMQQNQKNIVNAYNQYLEHLYEKLMIETERKEAIRGEKLRKEQIERETRENIARELAENPFKVIRLPASEYVQMQSEVAELLNKGYALNGAVVVDTEGYLVQTLIAQQRLQSPICPACGKFMTRKNGAYGAFWGCGGYPDCKMTFSDLLGSPVFPDESEMKKAKERLQYFQKIKEKNSARNKKTKKRGNL